MSKTFILLEVTENLNATNINEDIAELGGAYRIVDSVSAAEGVVEALGQPEIKWSDDFV